MEKKGILLNKKSILIFLILLVFEIWFGFYFSKWLWIANSKYIIQNDNSALFDPYTNKKRQLMPLYIQTRLDDFFKKESK